MLPEKAAERELVEAEARRILGGAGFRRIETPTFEATELFARGVGESTDIVQKEMYTFDDGGGRSVTLRPEGTAPVCRAYLEHGMHKEAQPVKLWYFSPFYRREAPQLGRQREFWQIGAETIGSEDPAVDAELIVLLSELYEALHVGGVTLRLSSAGHPGDAPRLPRGALDLPARQPGHALRGRPRADRPQPDARLGLRPSRHPGGDARRAPPARAPRRRRRRALRAGPRPARDGRHRLRGRPHARPRPGLLHAHGLRVHVRRARRAERRRRRRALRRPRSSRSAGRRPRAAAGPRASSASCSPRAASRRAEPPVDLFVAFAKDDRRVEGFRIATEARAPASTPSSSSPDARSRASSSRPTGSARAATAILGDEGATLKDMESRRASEVVAPEEVIAATARGDESL